MNRKKKKQKSFKKTSIEKQIEVDAITESRELIGEIYTKPYEVVRIFKIKYKNCTHNHIDLRFWNLNPNEFEDCEDGIKEKKEFTMFPTQKGFQVQEERFKKLIQYYL